MVSRRDPEKRESGPHISRRESFVTLAPATPHNPSEEESYETKKSQAETVEDPVWEIVATHCLMQARNQN